MTLALALEFSPSSGQWCKRTSNTSILVLQLKLAWSSLLRWILKTSHSTGKVIIILSLNTFLNLSRTFLKWMIWTRRKWKYSSIRQNNSIKLIGLDHFKPSHIDRFWIFSHRSWFRMHQEMLIFWQPWRIILSKISFLNLKHGWELVPASGSFTAISPPNKPTRSPPMPTTPWTSFQSTLKISSIAMFLNWLRVNPFFISRNLLRLIIRQTVVSHISSSASDKVTSKPVFATHWFTHFWTLHLNMSLKQEVGAIR